MAKLTTFEREMFNLIREEFADDLYVVAIPEAGLTIAIQETNDRMRNHVRVYVTQCSVNEKFKFKRGVLAVYNKMQNDNYIVIPISGRTNTNIIQDMLELYATGVDLYNCDNVRYL